MAQIKEYSAGAIGLRPTETGAEAQAATGRRISSNYNESAAMKQAEGQRIASTITGLGNEIISYAEQREKSAGALRQQADFNALTQKWNETAKGSDPNDPSVAAKFREEVMEPQLEKFASSFRTEGGQKWAEAHVASMRQHFDHKMTADMSSMAGIAAHNNVVQSANIAANTVRADPSALSTVLRDIDGNVQTIVDSAPNLSPVDNARVSTELKQKMKSQIVMAGVQSAIENNPDAGMRMAKDPQYAPYVDASHAESLYRQAVRAKKTDEALAKSNRDRALHDANEKTMDAVVKDLYSDDPKITAKQILAIPDTQITRAGREHLLMVAERRAEKDTLTPAVAKQNFVEVIDQIRNGDITNVDQIYDRMAKGDLDYTRAKQAIREFMDVRTPEGETLGVARKRFMSAIDPILNPKDSFGNYQAEGKQRKADLEILAQQEEARMRAAGKNPHEIYNKASPDYLGSRPEARGPTPYDLQQAALEKVKAQGNKNHPLNTRPDPTSPQPTSPQPTSPAPDAPKGYPSARKAKDGNWYVEQDGKYFMVETPRPPMSR